MGETVDLNADPKACAAWVARFLKARGIDRIFGLQGGHIQPIWDHSPRLGIRIVDVRHEGAAVHMAHAHAELTGGLGVAMVTAGPGVTNAVTAVANASLARAPVLVIGGCPPRPQVNMGPLQDIPHVDILRPVTRTVAHAARRRPGAARARRGGGARDRATWASPGRSIVEIPTDVLRTHVPRRARARRVDGAPSRRADRPTRRDQRRGRGAVVGAGARSSSPAAAPGARRRSWCACSTPRAPLYLDTQESRGLVPPTIRPSSGADARRRRWRRPTWSSSSAASSTTSSATARRPCSRTPASCASPTTPAS